MHQAILKSHSDLWKIEKTDLSIKKIIVVSGSLYTHIHTKKHDIIRRSERIVPWKLKFASELLHSSKELLHHHLMHSKQEAKPREEKLYRSEPVDLRFCYKPSRRDLRWSESFLNLSSESTGETGVKTEGTQGTRETRRHIHIPLITGVKTSASSITQRSAT